MVSTNINHLGLLRTRSNVLRHHERNESIHIVLLSANIPLIQVQNRLLCGDGYHNRLWNRARFSRFVPV